jgi:hypothetical protein
MAELVSPCCGGEYTDNKDGRSYCCGATILNSICSNKDCLDHAEPEEGFICDACEEFFKEPLEDYEFDEQMKERIAEDKADEARDMGL